MTCTISESIQQFTQTKRRLSSSTDCHPERVAAATSRKPALSEVEWGPAAASRPTCLIRLRKGLFLSAFKATSGNFEFFLNECTDTSGEFLRDVLIEAAIKFETPMFCDLIGVFALDWVCFESEIHASGDSASGGVFRDKS
jgi:hypothetical protein